MDTTYIVNGIAGNKTREVNTGCEQSWVYTVSHVPHIVWSIRKPVITRWAILRVNRIERKHSPERTAWGVNNIGCAQCRVQTLSMVTIIEDQRYWGNGKSLLKLLPNRARSLSWVPKDPGRRPFVEPAYRLTVRGSKSSPSSGGQCLERVKHPPAREAGYAQQHGRRCARGAPPETPPPGPPTNTLIVDYPSIIWAFAWYLFLSLLLRGFIGLQ